MRVLVAGDLMNPILLDTNKASAILIETDDGKPSVLFKLLDGDKGWLRLTKGEDANFNTVAKELGLT